jgi:hypothetical protein
MKKKWALFTLILFVLAQLPSLTAVKSRLNIDYNNSKQSSNKKQISLLAKNCKFVRGDASFVVCAAGEAKKDEQGYGRTRAHLLKKKSIKLVKDLRKSKNKPVKPIIEKKTQHNKGTRKISFEKEFCEVVPGTPLTLVCLVGSSKQARVTKESLSQIKQTARVLHKNYKSKKPRSSNKRNLFAYSTSSVDDNYGDSCYEDFAMSCDDCYWYYGMSCADYEDLMTDPCYTDPYRPECTDSVGCNNYSDCPTEYCNTHPDDYMYCGGTPPSSCSYPHDWDNTQCGGSYCSTQGSSDYSNCPTEYCNTHPDDYMYCGGA